MIEGIRKMLAAAWNILLPSVCIVCGRKLLLNERHICLNCRMDMPLTYFWNMPVNPMSDRFNEVIQKDLDSAPEKREIYARAAALFFYKRESQYRKIPYFIKYQGGIRAAEHFGRMLGKRLAASNIWNDCDLIIPVPLHWTRKWKRGYNQAEIIAGSIAATMNIPIRTDLLTRRRRTITQTRLDIEGKAKNVAGAFEVTETAAELMKERPDIRRILLIDDVFTTGSTLMACFTALRTVFPPDVRISVATLGFVGEA